MTAAQLQEAGAKLRKTADLALFASSAHAESAKPLQQRKTTSL